MSTVAPPRPPADDRLRARWVSVARQAGRRRLSRLVVLGVSLAVLLLLAGISRSPLLAVQRVRFLGPQRTSSDALNAAIGPVRGHPIYAVDVGAIARRVSSLPWIMSARVTRAWPQTLEVTVTERTALGVARAGDGSLRLVDEFGRVLDTADQVPDGMTEIVGPVTAGLPGTSLDPGAGPALSVVRALPAPLVGRVTQVEWARDGQVQLGLSPHGRVLLGPATDVPAKLLALLTLLDHVKPADVGEIDLRAPGAPSLRRADLTVIAGSARGRAPPPASVPATSAPANSLPAATVPATSAPAKSVPAATVPPTSAPAKSGSATSQPVGPALSSSAPARAVPPTSAPSTTKPSPQGPHR